MYVELSIINKTIAMTKVSNLHVICIPTETQDEIGPDATYEQLQKYIAENDDYSVYDLGRYFHDQNDDSLGLHWSFLVDTANGEVLNGTYNSMLVNMKEQKMETVINKVIEAFPEMDTDEPIEGSEAVDTICQLWDELKESVK